MPASKSHTIRALALSALATGDSTIHNPLNSQDTLNAVECYRALGAQIDTVSADLWRVSGNAGQIKAPPEPVDIGNSGTTLRLAMGSAALLPPDAAVILTGDQQARTRPIRPLMDSLNSLGAKCTSVKANDRAPVRVQGHLSGGTTSIACHTSQYLSSLLLATPLADRDTQIEVTLLNEPDYVRMTLDWLDRQKIRYENDSLRHFKISGRQSYRPFDTDIPADFSSATFFLCAAAILPGEVVLEGLDFTDSQPDKAVVDYLRAMGADISLQADKVRIRNSQLKGAEIDMNRTPDALCAMAIAGAFAEGTTRLVNVPQARTKETDRIKCMAEELAKMSIEVQELPDGLVISNSRPQPATLNGRGDHRIVMALSIAAMATEGTTIIDTAEAMRVTFPNYLDLMRNLGANMKIVD